MTEVGLLNKIVSNILSGVWVGPTELAKLNHDDYAHVLAAILTEINDIKRQLRGVTKA